MVRTLTAIYYCYKNTTVIRIVTITLFSHPMLSMPPKDIPPKFMFMNGYNASCSLPTLSTPSTDITPHIMLFGVVAA